MAEIKQVTVNGETYTLKDGTARELVESIESAISNVDNTADADKSVLYATSAGTADALTTARTIDGVSFDGSAAIVHYGTCSVAAATAAKTVSVSNFTLVTGARVLVRFSYANTASSPTLNVNGTGAKSIRYRNAAVPTGYIQQYGVYEFVYSGTYWYLVGDVTSYLVSSCMAVTSLWSGLAKEATVTLELGSNERLFMIMGIFSSDGSNSNQEKALGKQVYWLRTTSTSNYTASKYASVGSTYADMITITGAGSGEAVFASSEMATSTYHFYITNIYQVTI